LTSSHLDDASEFVFTIQEDFEFTDTFGAVSNTLVVVPDFDGGQVGAQHEIYYHLKKDRRALWQR